MNKVLLNNNHSYQDYLKKIHKKSVIENHALQAIVKEATSQNISSKIRIISGEINEVYDVLLTNNDRIIVRISKNGDAEFRREEWAQQQCKKIGIPVPETIAISRLTNTIFVCIQQRIEGEPLERGSIDYWSLSEDKIKRYMNQAGYILSQIHTINTEGFGYIDNNGKGEKQSFMEEMTEHISHEKSFRSAFEKFGLDTRLLKKIFQILTKQAQSISEIKSVLNHNDYAPKHLLVRDLDIVGVIDFGQAAGHSPVNDFARWLYWYGHSTMKYLKEGYDNKSLFNEEFDNQLSWIAIHNGLSTLWWYIEKNYSDGIEDAYKRLIKVTELYMQ